MMNKLVVGLLLSAIYCTSALADFSGADAIVGWTLGGPAGNNNGIVDTSSAPTSISLISNDTGLHDANQDFTFVAFEDATISFDWTFSTVDTGTSATHGNQWDPFGYLLGVAFTQLSDDSGAVNTGSVTFSVSIGDIFGFRSNTVDGLYGSSTTSVAGFSAVATAPMVVPLPPSVSLLICAFGGLVLVQRRRKQAAFGVPRTI
jgi:hypothetical protein